MSGLPMNLPAAIRNGGEMAGESPSRDYERLIQAIENPLGNGLRTKNLIFHAGSPRQGAWKAGPTHDYERIFAEQGHPFLGISARNQTSNLCKSI